jgi:hypothetical protein
LWGHLPNLTYAILFLGYSMTSVHSGTKLVQEAKEPRALQHSCLYSPFGFAIFTSLCIKVPMLPRLRSPLPPTIRLHSVRAIVVSIVRHRQSSPRLDRSCSCSPVPLLTQPADSPDASPHHSTSGGSTVSRQVKEASIIAGPLRHLIRRHLAKSETALRPPQPLHPPYQFTPVHIPQMRHHQVL